MNEFLGSIDFSSIPAGVVAGLIVMLIVGIIPPIRYRLAEAIRYLSEIIGSSGVRLVSRSRYKEILDLKLDDPSVNRIDMIVYTGEVDSGGLNHFLNPNVKIRIFKRSIFADLREQQTINLRRLAIGKPDIRRWNKYSNSLIVSQHIENEKEQGLNIQQYFYDGRPVLRTYLFDNDKEAISAQYEVSDIDEGGSLYKGFTGRTKAIHLNSNRTRGAYAIANLRNELSGLRLTSHSWEVEKRLLGDAENGASPPIFNVRTVLLDMDGVLFDSLGRYVTAWQEAFQNGANLKYPKNLVYEEEGRSGTETIKRYLKKVGVKPNSEIVNRIYGIKQEILSNLPLPNPCSGAELLVQALDRSGIQLFVVTGSTNREMLDHLSAKFSEIPSNAIVTGDNSERGKPFPDPFRKALEIAKAKRRNTLVIENAPLGIRAAREAGLMVIAVNTGELSDEALIEAGAAAVFKNCHSIAATWDSIREILAVETIS